MLDNLIKMKNTVTLTLAILIAVCWAMCGKIPNTLMYIVLMSLIIIFIVFHLFVAILETFFGKKLISYIANLEEDNQ